MRRERGCLYEKPLVESLDVKRAYWPNIMWCSPSNKIAFCLAYGIDDGTGDMDYHMIIENKLQTILVHWPE